MLFIKHMNFISIDNIFQRFTHITITFECNIISFMTKKIKFHCTKFKICVIRHQCNISLKSSIHITCIIFFYTTYYIHNFFSLYHYVYVFKYFYTLISKKRVSSFPNIYHNAPYKVPFLVLICMLLMLHTLVRSVARSLERSPARPAVEILRFDKLKCVFVITNTSCSPNKLPVLLLLFKRNAFLRLLLLYFTLGICN